MITWRGNSVVSDVQCAPSVLVEIGELAMSGYGRYPWGGVETGGVLFGTKGPGTVQIRAVRSVECEHQYGPAFELSENDCEAFEHVLRSARVNEQQTGLTPVGWYQSTSRRDVGLSEHARLSFQRFFPEPWQVAMVVQRSKQGPLFVGIFVRDSKGRVDLHSPMQEFTLEVLRQQVQTASATPGSF